MQNLIWPTLLLVLIFPSRHSISADQDDVLQVENFLRTYRDAVAKQVGQLKDVEIETDEEISGRGHYRRKIFVCAPKNGDTIYSQRGDILESKDALPSQNIFARVHLCRGGEVIFLVKRGAITNFFEIRAINKASIQSVEASLTTNVDHIGYSGFAWCGTRWIDVLEMPNAVKKISRRTEDGIELIDVSFELQIEQMVAGIEPRFRRGIVTFEPARDWICRSLCTPDDGNRLTADPTKSVFFTSSIDFKNYDGMWLPVKRVYRRVVKDEHGTLIDDSGASETVVRVKVGPISVARFDLPTYGLGSSHEGSGYSGKYRWMIFGANVVIVGILALFLIRKRKKQVGDVSSDRIPEAN